MSGIDVKSLYLTELKDEIDRLDISPFRAQQIYQWLHVKGVSSFDEMTNISKKHREDLSNYFTVLNCDIEEKFISKTDGTVKYLYRLNDGEYIEAVLMKYKYGYTLCISTQVGCKMGCEFCASGKGGFVRNLRPSEMLSQIHTAQNDMNVRVSHIVLMGMGEPLDNYENVLKFLKLVSDSNGLNIGMRNITLSTSGLVDRINELLNEKLQLTLSVSLHAPNNKIRNSIMPVNKKYPIEDLLAVCRKYAQITSRRVSFEYAMISGLNDSIENAKELSERLKGILCHVNLIPINNIKEMNFQKSSTKKLEEFISVVRKNRINVTVRRSLGADIDASCGQLRSRHQSREV